MIDDYLVVLGDQLGKGTMGDYLNDIGDEGL
jgi:hypothetical protein